MTTGILGMDVVVGNIEVITYDIHEGIVCFLVRSMRTAIHQLQGIAPADVIGDGWRIMADDL